MKKIDYSKADQVAAKMAEINVTYDQSFWDRVQAQFERMTGGPEIKPRQESKTHTQTERYGN